MVNVLPWPAWLATKIWPWCYFTMVLHRASFAGYVERLGQVGGQASIGPEGIKLFC